MNYSIKVRTYSIKNDEVNVEFVPLDENLYECDGTREGAFEMVCAAAKKHLMPKGVFRLATEDGTENGMQIEIGLDTKDGHYKGLTQVDIFAHSFWSERNKEKDAERICPECGKKYYFYPALSRLDNETAVCGECGTREAIFDYQFKTTLPDRGGYGA